MSDGRIEKALLQGPPDEPAYVARLTPADLHGPATAAPRAKWRSRILAGVAQAAAAAVLVVAVVGIVPGPVRRVRSGHEALDPPGGRPGSGCHPDRGTAGSAPGDHTRRGPVWL